MFEQFGGSREDRRLPGNLASLVSERGGIGGSVGIGGADDDVADLDVRSQTARGPGGQHDLGGEAGHGPAERI